MLYIVDTAQWPQQEVIEECKARNIAVRDGLEQVAVTKLASQLVKEQICRDFEASAVNTDEKGRPYLEGCNADFNLSHHDTWLIAVASDQTDQQLGIDITDFEVTMFDSAQLSKLFVVAPKTPREAAMFWAAREAYLKHTGEGYRETPVKVAKPSHTVIPDIMSSSLVPMPLIKVENTYARLFMLGQTIGAVIAPADALKELTTGGSGSDHPEQLEQLEQEKLEKEKLEKESFDQELNAGIGLTGLAGPE